jgi:DNA polymerase-3 subunit beta
MIQSVDLLLESTETGAMLLPAKEMSTMFDKLPSDADVTLDQEGQVITLKCRKFTLRLPVVSSTLFPSIEAFPEAQFQLKTATLKQLVERTEFAAPGTSANHAVACVLIQSVGGRLRAVGTDGFRVAVAEADGGPTTDFSLLLSKDSIHLTRELPGETVYVAQSDTNLFFKADGGHTVRISKTIAKFPPYERALAVAAKTAVYIAVPTLETLISLVSAIADSKDPAIHMTVKGNTLEVSAVSAFGSSDETVDVEYATDNLRADNRIRINPKFIQEGLNVFDGGRVAVKMSSDRTLAEFADDKGTYRYFVMPMQEPTAAAEKKA